MDERVRVRIVRAAAAGGKDDSARVVLELENRVALRSMSLLLQSDGAVLRVRNRPELEPIPWSSNFDWEEIHQLESRRFLQEGEPPVATPVGSYPGRARREIARLLVRLAEGGAFRSLDGEEVFSPLELSAGSEVGVIAPSTPFRRADANADGAIDLSDPVTILHFLFPGGRSAPCLDGADADDSERLDLSDAVFLLDWLFRGGGAPPPPFGSRGLDPVVGGGRSRLRRLPLRVRGSRGERRDRRRVGTSIFPCIGRGWRR